MILRIMSSPSEEINSFFRFINSPARISGGGAPYIVIYFYFNRGKHVKGCTGIFSTEIEQQECRAGCKSRKSHKQDLPDK
jgi:hypothetical protein